VTQSVQGGEDILWLCAQLAALHTLASRPSGLANVRSAAKF